MTNTIQNGISCPLCNDNMSSGHKLVCSLLEELKENYVNEKCFEWSQNRQYDIYIERLACIIEINGRQHYNKAFRKRGMDKPARTVKEEHDNDIFKKRLAESNGIERYIYIDCRQSDFEWEKNHIINSKLSKLYDLSNINWTKVYQNSLKSNVLKACESWNNGVSVFDIAKDIKVRTGTIQRYLHSCNDAGMCVYKGLDEKNKPVVCLNTGEIFNKLMDAGKKYDIDSNGISFVCNGLRNRTFAGKLSDGTKLKWLFLDDYKLKTKEEIQIILESDKNKKIVGKKKVICLNTLEVFNSIKDAKLKYNAPSISDCCRHICKFSGNLNNHKLQWMYYDEYLKEKADLDSSKSA